MEHNHTHFHKLENKTKRRRQDEQKHKIQTFNIQSFRNPPKFISHPRTSVARIKPYRPRYHFQKLDSFLFVRDHSALTKPCLDIMQMALKMPDPRFRPLKSIVPHSTSLQYNKYAPFPMPHAHCATQNKVTSLCFS